MSRFFRLYEKKRGNRRTGSPAVGNAGEAAFFGIFFVVGCIAMAYMLVALVWPEWRANRQFEPTSGIVLEKRVGQSPDPRAVNESGEPPMYRPEFKVRYETAEGKYEADNVYDATNLYSADRASVQQALDQFEVGSEYPMWYDPIEPGRVVLVRGYSAWLYVSLLIPLSLLAIGGGRMIYALVHWNASHERRNILEQKASRREVFQGAGTDQEFPTVPADANLTNSPGTTLAYRLPTSATPGWKLFATVAACIGWNTIVVLFAILAVRRFVGGESDWLLVALLVPFTLGGIGLAIYLSRQIMLATGVGPTRIEISSHPLHPGEPYEVFLSQMGRLDMQSLEIWLACDERATFRQGTDTRTESRRVFERRSFVRENFEIAQGLPFESRCQVSVPPGAMHSFHAGHNEVSWKLIVKGKVRGRPDYERAFQIVVSPVASGRGNG